MEHWANNVDCWLPHTAVHTSGTGAADAVAGACDGAHTNKLDAFHNLQTKPAPHTHRRQDKTVLVSVCHSGSDRCTACGMKSLV